MEPAQGADDESPQPKEEDIESARCQDFHPKQDKSKKNPQPPGHLAHVGMDG
jgi:hypothetical protein